MRSLNYRNIIRTFTLRECPMQVVPFPENKKLDDRELERRRLAVQIAAQLPAEAAEAVLVLEAALTLVRLFLTPGGA